MEDTPRSMSVHVDLQKTRDTIIQKHIRTDPK